MAAKLTRLTHKIKLQLLLVAESCTICRSCSRRPVRKPLDTPSYMTVWFQVVLYVSILSRTCDCSTVYIRYHNRGTAATHHTHAVEYCQSSNSRLLGVFSLSLFFFFYFSRKEHKREESEVANDKHGKSISSIPKGERKQCVLDTSVFSSPCSVL
jgi:hypothetical protein